MSTAGDGLDLVLHLLFSPDGSGRKWSPPLNLIEENRENINVNGTNTWVHVPRGDVGTNTSAFTNSGGAAPAVLGIGELEQVG